MPSYSLAWPYSSLGILTAMYVHMQKFELQLRHKTVHYTCTIVLWYLPVEPP